MSRQFSPTRSSLTGRCLGEEASIILNVEANDTNSALTMFDTVNDDIAAIEKRRNSTSHTGRRHRHHQRRCRRRHRNDPPFLPRPCQQRQ